MRQSFVLPCFRSPDQPLADLFREARRIGYAATEIWGPDAEGETLENVYEAARSAGLAVASFTGHDAIERGLNDPAQWERIEAELVRSLDRAAALGVPGVIVFSGTRTPGLSDAYGLARFVEGARRVVSHAEARGVNLNLEILNSHIDHPGYMADTVDWAVAACAAVASPRFRLLFDVYHVQTMEGDLLRGLRRAAPYLGHVHTAGVPGRHELDDDQEIGYRAVGRELRRLGYEGYVGHEFFPKGDRIDALRQAHAAMLDP